MNRSQRETLKSIFRHPVSGTIKWIDVVSAMLALGADMEESKGSAVWFGLKGRSIVLHKPHPRKELDKGAVRSLRKFLESIEIVP